MPFPSSISSSRKTRSLLPLLLVREPLSYELLLALLGILYVWPPKFGWRNQKMSIKLGLRWIADHTGITSAQPFAVENCIGSMRKTIVQNIVRQEIYSATARTEPTIPAHLTFAFKHKVVHLEFLARLFAAIDPKVLVNWISAEPTGGYARRAGFFFEWLTGKILDVPDTPAGNYIEALDPNQYLVASRAVNVPRWRVRDNLPGTRDFCPTVVRNDAIRKLEQYNCREALNRLEVEFGADIILRSAVWLTIKESKASFAIEHEEKQVDRIRRFAAVMERRAGEEGDPLEIEALTTLQTEILGAATRYGVRRSPVFVGHTSGYTDVVDYIAPH